MWQLLTLALNLQPSYYNDPRIHNLGNVGLGGHFHACLAPIATNIITQRAYGGFEPREWLHNELPEGRCVDFGCGVGLSTRDGDIGIDTSPQMINHARTIWGKNKTFMIGNIETWTAGYFNAVTMSFVTHEMPRHARIKAMHNALTMTERLIVMDIAETYAPSRLMLTGEPYIKNYLKHMQTDINLISAVHGAKVKKRELLEDHVTVWDMRVI